VGFQYLIVSHKSNYHIPILNVALFDGVVLWLEFTF